MYKKELDAHIKDKHSQDTKKHEENAQKGLSVTNACLGMGGSRKHSKQKFR